MATDTMGGINMRSFFAGLIVAAAALGQSAVQAIPMTYTGLYNTGVNAAGVSQASTTAEAHWCVFIGSSSSCDTPFVYADPSGYPIPPWLSGLAGGASGWISPFLNTFGVLNEIYTYRYQFTGVSGPLAARDAHDDDLLGIKLFNVTTSLLVNTFSDSLPVHSFANWGSAIMLAASLNAADIYYLDYRVLNNGGGPTGLRVEFVPEPASLALTGLALGLLVAYRRRTRQPL